jgi:hypothetical protein
VAGSNRIESPNQILERTPTAVKERYQIVGRQGRRSEEALNRFTQAGGQFLLPLVELVEQARLAVDDVIHELGRKTIETILDLSAQEVAGPRALGKARSEVRWHGSQSGRVKLRDRQMQVTRPRLRRKGAGEEKVPAYEALRDNPATCSGPNFLDRKRGLLRWWAALKIEESQCPEAARVTRPA